MYFAQTMDICSHQTINKLTQQSVSQSVLHHGRKTLSFGSTGSYKGFIRQSYLSKHKLMLNTLMLYCCHTLILLPNLALDFMPLAICFFAKFKSITCFRQHKKLLKKRANNSVLQGSCSCTDREDRIGIRVFPGSQRHGKWVISHAKYQKIQRNSRSEK